MATDPPAVRWVPEGEHAGFYIYAPALNGWKRIFVTEVGVFDWTVVDPPEGSEGLYCYADVSDLIDQYRDTLLAHQEAIREDGDRRDAHDGAKAEVLTELVDAEDYAVTRADERYEMARRKVAES